MQLKSRYGCRIIALMLIMATVLVGCSSKKEKDTTESTATPEATASAEATENPEDEVIETVPLDTVMLTVDKAEYKLQDFMYLVYNLEEQYGYTASLYSQLYGIDFWNDVLEEDSTETGRDEVREQAMGIAEMLAVLAPVAIDAGYTLAEEDEELATEIVTDALANMDEEYLARTGFTEDNLTQMVRKYILVANYYNDQVESQKVDEESIKEDISYDDFKQTRIEYIYIETTYYDEDGEVQLYSPEQITEDLKSGRKMLKLVQQGTEMADAVEQVVGESDNIYVDTYDMYDDQMEESLANAIQSLKEGELYDDLVEVEEGYYIVRLVENNVTTDYDEEVENQILTQKQTEYELVYQELVELHEITINEDAWELVCFGNYAYPAIIDEDEEDSAYFDYSDVTDEEDIISPEEADGDDGSVG